MGISHVKAAIRPRIEGDREAEILDAAVDILVEHGYDRLTMDAVAVRAKASKATLYRRWSSKQHLVVDAVMRSKEGAHHPEPDTGSLRGDLLSAYCGAGGLVDQRSSRLLAAVLTALNTDPEFSEQFRTRFLEPKMAESQHIFERAKERGEICPDADISLIGPALAGILLHRNFLLGEEIDRTMVERVCDQIILPALEAQGQSPQADSAQPQNTEPQNTEN